MSSAPTSSPAASPTGFSGTGTKRDVSGARELPSPPTEEEEEEDEAAAGRSRAAAAPPWRTRPARDGSRSSGHAHRLIGSEGQRRRRRARASSRGDRPTAIRRACAAPPLCQGPAGSEPAAVRQGRKGGRGRAAAGHLRPSAAWCAVTGEPEATRAAAAKGRANQQRRRRC